ncbi:MAG: Rpn family recombination-promoting nuclease/putative transposase [Faecalimonas sp.]|nr:Rpn family recombination-promoting nuclease/putative transposase [Faecalimonas sp.]
MNTRKIASYKDATGKIHYNMTNDYLFRYILENNEKVLTGLTCSLLHLKPEEIKEITITNPIMQGSTVQDKEFILDIQVILNDEQVLGLEMQVANEGNWTDRALVYLCRTFDQLAHGQKYDEALPVTHIGFLDFTLFEDDPEFYATNMMLNIKSHRIFNDKFRLSVVNLSQIELATEEDKAWGVDYWARLFKAKTWEELKMLAEKNEFLEEAAQSVYVANEDEIIRQMCRAREDRERHERTIQRELKKLQELQEREAEMKQAVAQADQKLAEKDQQISEKDQQISEKDQQLSEKDQRISEKDQQLSEKDQQLSEKDQRIAELEKMLADAKK